MKTKKKINDTILSFIEKLNTIIEYLKINLCFQKYSGVFVVNSKVLFFFFGGFSIMYINVF